MHYRSLSDTAGTVYLGCGLALLCVLLDGCELVAHLVTDGCTGPWWRVRCGSA